MVGGRQDVASPSPAQHHEIETWHVWQGDVEDLPPEGARRVHVTARQFSRATLRALLQGCPHLREIQFMPSMWRCVGPGAQRLLESQGVSIRFGRMRQDSERYDRPSFSPLRERLRGRAHGRRWQLLQEHCPEAAALVTGLTGNGAEPPLSQIRLAEEWGRSIAWVRRRLQAAEAYLDGRPSDSRLDYERIIVRAVQQQALEADRRVKEAQSPFPIPVGLPRKGYAWQQFLFVARAWVERPDLFEELGARDGRLRDILVSTFGLENGVYVPLEVLAERYACTRSRVQQLKSEALRWLRQRLRKEEKSA